MATGVSVNPLAFAELCYQLNENELSQRELIERVGISDSTLRKWLKYLKKKQLIYICERRRTHNIGAYELIYTWGYKEKDVPPIPKLSLSESSRRYREKKQRGYLHGLANTTVTS